MSRESVAGPAAPFDRDEAPLLLQAVLSAIPFGIALLDRELRLVWSNPLLARAGPFRTEGALGRPLREFAPAAAGELEPSIRNLLASGASSAEFDCAPGRGGAAVSGRRCRGSLYALAVPGGRFLGIGIVVPPGDSPDEAGRPPDPGASRDGLWYGFLERFAHALKNPLTPLLTASQMLQRYGAERPEILEWAAVSIERQVRHLTSRLDEVLALARAETGTLRLGCEPIDFRAVLTPVLARFRGVADERRLTLVATFSSEALWVNGDADRLAQGVAGLLEHALGTTPAGGRVEVAARIEERDVVMRIRGGEADAGALDGVGDWLAAAARFGHQPAIGLALARAVVIVHGGTLGIAGDGTAEWVLRFPAVGAGPPGSG